MSNKPSVTGKKSLRVFSLFSLAIIINLLSYVAHAQFTNVRGDEIVNVDPSFQEFTVGGFTSQAGACKPSSSCQYGVDVKFLNPTVDGDTFTFSIGARAQQDLPAGSAGLNEDNTGNLLDQFGFEVSHGGSGKINLDPDAASNCTFVANNAVALRPNPLFGFVPGVDATVPGAFSGTIISNGTSNAQGYAMIAAYRPNSDTADANGAVYLNSQAFTPILDFTCDISQVTNLYAELAFAVSSYTEVSQLYGNNIFYSYATRYTNSLEFFPLDGTSAYIEEAHLADTNRHAFIKFSEDLPDDLVLSASMFGASHDSYGDDGLFTNFSASTIEATSVSKIASDTVWVTFPDALATAIANGNGLLHDVLLDFQPGTDGFIDTVSGGEKRALARVSAQYGEFGSGDNTGVPPRIISMEFNDSRNMLEVTFDQVVSSLPTTETSDVIAPLTADDFELLYWDGETSEKVGVIIGNLTTSRILLTISSPLDVARAASATNPVYFQLRTNPASAPSDAPQNQFYITTATIFSAESDGQVARTLPSPGGVSGDYGIGMRDIPGNGLIRFPELNVAPTITPALAVILAEDVDASNPMRTALLSEAGSGNMRLTIADGNDDGSVLPINATLVLTWSELPSNFEIPSYNSNILFDSITNVFGDTSAGSINVDASLNTISQVNGFLAGIEFTYGDFTGAARFTLTFNDGGNAPIGAAMEASAQIVITKDQIPPTIGSGVVSALEPRGTSTTISWTAATDQAGALDANGNPADGATSNDQIGYVIKIMDISRDITGAVDFRTGNASTTQEIAIPVGTSTGMEQYGLDRSNTVLIPGRSYRISIRAVDSAGLMSVGQNIGTFTMGPSTDSNENGIEDSIDAVGVVSNVNTYCGGSASDDSDNDGISNGRELEIGTDCRTASSANNNFADSGLTIDGANDLMLSLMSIGEANIADAYTVSNPVAGIGLTKIERGSLATVTCPSDNADCATIRPLLVVADAEACANLGGELETDFVSAEISGALCQAQDEDDIYLPVGFSEVIWKVQDSFGNILRSSNNDLRQLYYVAPEISVSPRKRYVQLNDNGGIDRTGLVANVNVNFGESSRYDGIFAGNISELDVSDFILTATSTGEDITDFNSAFEQDTALSSGTATYKYTYVTPPRNSADVNAGVFATLVLNTSGIRTIDSAEDTQLMIDRDAPGTYAYKIGNLMQEVEVIERIASAPTISFASGPAGSSGTLTIDNNDSEDQVILISLFDSSSDMEVGEDVFSSRTGLIRAGATSPTVIAAIRDSSASLAMRLRIFAPGDEALSNPLYERYCYNNNGQFCNAPESLFTDRNYSTSTSPSRTASVELISKLSHRAEGRYSANLTLDPNTSPEMKAMADTERFGDYGQFPSITFNIDIDSTSNRVFSPMIAVVVKLPALPDAGAYMHKYIDSQWRAFAEGDADGRLYSAKATNGFCPALVSPGDSGGISISVPDNDATNGDWSDIIDTATQSVLWYRTTRVDGSGNIDSLRAGDDCVLMWIADGGANDADGVRNGIVSDPSRIGAPADGSTVRRGGGGGGGGAVNTGLLFLLMLIAGAALIQRRKVAATHS